jgi:hypothetical protein
MLGLLNNEEGEDKLSALDNKSLLTDDQHEPLCPIHCLASLSEILTLALTLNRK